MPAGGFILRKRDTYGKPLEGGCELCRLRGMSLSIWRWLGVSPVTTASSEIVLPNVRHFAHPSIPVIPVNMGLDVEMRILTPLKIHNANPDPFETLNGEGIGGRSQVSEEIVLITRSQTNRTRSRFFNGNC